MNNEEKILSLLTTMHADIMEMHTEIAGMHTEIAGINQRLDKLEASQEQMRSDMQGLEARMQANMQSLETRMQTNMRDLETRLRGDIQSLEARMQANIQDLDERLRNVAIIQENEVLPRITLLAEGYATLAKRIEQLPDIQRIEALESDVRILKDTVRVHSQEIAALKEAR